MYRDVANFLAEVQEYLAARGVKTRGVDYLSVNGFNVDNMVHDSIIGSIRFLKDFD